MTDGVATTEESSITISVTNINDAPVLGDIGDQTTPEDTPKMVVLSSSDADQDDLTYTPTSSENISATILDGTLTLTPAANWYGSEDVTVTIEDGDEETDSETFTVTVTPVNDQPTIGEVENQTTEEDTSKSITLVVGDVDGDELTISTLGSDFVSSSVVGTTLTIDPDEDFHGTDFVTISVTDGHSEPVTENFMITVNPVNDDPVLEAVGDQTTAEDTPLEITLAASDVDDEVFLTPRSVKTGNDQEEADKGHAAKTVDTSNELTFSAESADETKLTVSINGDALTFTPAPNYFGTVEVIITVEDGDGGSDSETIDVIVTPVNDLPVLQEISAQSVDEDTPKVITLSATDIEDEDSTLAFTIESSASEVSSSVEGTQLTLTSDPNWYGTSDITVTVTDSEDGEDEVSFTFAVNSVNDSPTIQNPGNQEFTEKDVHPVQLVISDLETASPTVQVLSSNEGLEASLEGHTLSLTSDGWYGDATITVTVLDEHEGSSSITFDVHVNPYNIHPPTHTYPASSPEDALGVDVCPQLFTFSIAEGTPIQVDDLDSIHLKTTLEVQNGELILPSDTGLEYLEGTQNRSAKIVITGSITDINNALDGLAYCGAPGYFGPDVLTLHSDDLQGLETSNVIYLNVQIVALPGQSGVLQVDLKTQAQKKAQEEGKEIDETVEPEVVFNTEEFSQAEFIGEGDDLELVVLPHIMTESDTDGSSSSDKSHVTVNYPVVGGGDPVPVEVPVVIYRPRVDVTSRISSIAQLNVVTGFYEQTVTVANTMPYPMRAIRIYADGLEGNAELFAKTGSKLIGDRTLPYIQYDVVIPNQQGEGDTSHIREFTIELKSFNRIWQGQVSVLLELLAEPGEDSLPDGLEGIGLTPTVHHDTRDIYLNFDTVLDQTYFVQYRSPSDDKWTTSNVTIQGDGRPAVWVDDGPPKSISHPKDVVDARFYRVVIYNVEENDD